MTTTTVLCNGMMLALLEPLEQSKPVQRRYEPWFVAVYDTAALSAVLEERIEDAEAWWREMGGCNTRIDFDQDYIRAEGVLNYLCDTYGISTERNVAVALAGMALNAGMTRIELANWCADNAPLDVTRAEQPAGKPTD